MERAAYCVRWSQRGIKEVPSTFAVVVRSNVGVSQKVQSSRQHGEEPVAVEMTVLMATP